ncbi:MAG: hypothetical protein WBR18_05650 [Anaerolineales bacterium]
MASFLHFLRRFLGVRPSPMSSAPTRRASSTRQPQSTRPAATRPQTTRPPRVHRLSPHRPGSSDATLISGTDQHHYKDVDEYLQQLQEKVNRLAEEFANGTINREQFQQLFEHYQKERTAIQNWRDSTASTGDWKDLSNEGKSLVIRTKNTAKVLGYAIYQNESGMPLTTIGDFDIDPDLAVPMLSSYRSAAKEIFGGEMRSTEIEGGKWLCFVPGELTTMLALFTVEPATRQLSIMEDLHRLFEKANRRHLSSPLINPDELAFPHASYLGRLL